MSDVPDPANPAGLAPSVEAPASPYTGVGGWLLLLCLGLTVLSPLISMISLVTGYNDSSPFFEQFPGLKIIVTVDAVLSALLMAFSVYAGIGLWTVRPGAVVMAKRYLFCFLGYHVVAAVLPFLAGLPQDANDAMMPLVVKSAAQGFVFFALWYSYLNKSQRVRATYRA